MKRRLVFLFLFAPLLLRAQLGGTATYRFLSLPSSAAQIALGGKQLVSMDNSLLQDFSNPALIDSMQLHTVALNAGQWISDIHYGQLGYVWPTRYGLFFTGIHYLNYGRFTAADADGNITGSFGAGETALVLGYAVSLAHGWRAGMNLKWIHSVLESYRSDGLAADFSLDYRNEKGGEWVLAFRNMGQQLTTYNGTPEPLPFEVDLGYAQLLEHAPFRFYVTAENLQKLKIAFVNTAHDQQDPNGQVIHENITWMQHVFRHFVVGAEIFPRKPFRFRMGYSFRRAAELGFKDIRFSSGLSFGAELRLRRFSVQYGYGQMHAAGSNHFLSVHLYLQPSQSHDR